MNGLPNENSLALSAEGKLEFYTVWAYRFRLADFFGTAAMPVLLAAPLRLFGVMGFWTVILLFQTLAATALARWLRLVSAGLIGLSVVLAPALLFWSAAAIALSAAILRLISTLRQKMTSKKARAMAACNIVALLTIAAYCLYVALLLANPRHVLHRQSVLGGKSFRDALNVTQKAHKLQLSETCVAAINPDDLRAVSSAEKIQLKSLRSFKQLVLIDLKVVESNYRLLSLRDEKGNYLFSGSARAFASAETRYAGNQLPLLLKADKLCLIANFEALPATERPPYSRARMLYDLRKKAGRDTLIIQLAVR